jgi:hypothetical protein
MENVFIFCLLMIFALAMLLVSYLVLWALYAYALVPLGMPVLGYGQFAAIWFLLTALIGAFNFRISKK